MTTTAMTAITPASGHPPVIASGVDVATGVSEHTWRAYQAGWQRFWGGLGPSYSRPSHPRRT